MARRTSCHFISLCHDSLRTQIKVFCGGNASKMIHLRFSLAFIICLKWHFSRGTNAAFCKKKGQNVTHGKLSINQFS